MNLNVNVASEGGTGTGEARWVRYDRDVATIKPTLILP